MFNGSRENKFLSCWLALLEPAPAAAGSAGVTTYCRLWRVGAPMRNRSSAALGIRPEGHGGGSGPTRPRSPRIGWALINTPLRQRARMPSSTAGRPAWGRSRKGAERSGQLPLSTTLHSAAALATLGANPGYCACASRGPLSLSNVRVTVVAIHAPPSWQGLVP